MSNWFFEKKDFRSTPSILDGISYETEQRYRREGARFIINMGNKLNLQYDTIATGIVYFHRFYMIHSFRTFPRYVTACCCLFLAGKVEETPKKCKDIIKTARALLNDSQFAQFGEDPKEEVMTLERILLQTIKFDLQVEHPYVHLLKYIKCLKGDKAKIHKILQMAWTFVNDSLCTTLSLQWEPEIIAIALMYLAGKLSKFEVTDWTGRTSKHSNWWDMFVIDLDSDLLEDICHQVLDLYTTPPPSTPQDSPPLSPAPPPTTTVATTATPPPPPPTKPVVSSTKTASPKVVAAVNSPAKEPPASQKVGLPIPKIGDPIITEKIATPPHPIPVVIASTAADSTGHPPPPPPPPPSGPIIESPYVTPTPAPPSVVVSVPLEDHHPYIHPLTAQTAPSPAKIAIPIVSTLPTAVVGNPAVHTTTNFLTQPPAFPPLPAEKPPAAIIVQPPPPPFKQSSFFAPPPEPQNTTFYPPPPSPHFPPPPPPSQALPPPPPTQPPPATYQESQYTVHDYHHMPPSHGHRSTQYHTPPRPLHYHPPSPYYPPNRAAPGSAGNRRY